MITFRIASRIKVCRDLMLKYGRLDLEPLLERHPEWNSINHKALWLRQTEHLSEYDEFYKYLPKPIFDLLGGYCEKHDQYGIKWYHSHDTAMIYFTKALKKYIRTNKI